MEIINQDALRDLIKQIVKEELTSQSNPNPAPTPINQGTSQVVDTFKPTDPIMPNATGPTLVVPEQSAPPVATQPAASATTANITTNSDSPATGTNIQDMPIG